MANKNKLLNSRGNEGAWGDSSRDAFWKTEADKTEKRKLLPEN